MEINRLVRYLLIITCLNFVFSMIIAIIIWISRIFEWQWYAWQWYDWYIFFSVLIPIAIFIIYLSPFIEQKLFNFLEDRMSSLKKERIKDLEEQLEKLKKEGGDI